MITEGAPSLHSQYPLPHAVLYSPGACCDTPIVLARDLSSSWVNNFTSNVDSFDRKTKSASLFFSSFTRILAISTLPSPLKSASVKRYRFGSCSRIGISYAVSRTVGARQPSGIGGNDDAQPNVENKLNATAVRYLMTFNWSPWLITEQFQKINSQLLALLKYCRCERSSSVRNCHANSSYY